MHTINATHDPRRRSWLESANSPDSDFPIQNLPFGVFDDGSGQRGGMALGDRIIDLGSLVAAGVLDGAALDAARLACGDSLKPLFTADPAAVSALRAALSELFRTGGSGNPDALGGCLVPMADARMQLPARVEAFTDFCTSIDHIRRMGANSPIPERLAWTHLPVAYNGRAASVAVDGTPVVRPWGQMEIPPQSGHVVYQPEPMLDYELEFGAWLRTGSELGQPIDVDDAESRLFGCCLVNDWSARGIQFFEATLGPYCGKGCLTTISPWVVTMEALAPFRIAGPVRQAGEPPVPRYLDGERNRARGGIAISLIAALSSEAMRADGMAPLVTTSTRLEHLYWTLAQMVAHATSSGSPLLAGELIGSGTVSGPDPAERACLAEVNFTGDRTPLLLPSGETRGWLQDGDCVTITGRAEAAGFVPIGFGRCSGTITAARS